MRKKENKNECPICGQVLYKEYMTKLQMGVKCKQIADMNKNITKITITYKNTDGSYTDRCYDYYTNIRAEVDCQNLKSMFYRVKGRQNAALCFSKQW